MIWFEMISSTMGNSIFTAATDPRQNSFRTSVHRKRKNNFKQETSVGNENAFSQFWDFFFFYFARHFHSVAQDSLPPTAIPRISFLLRVEISQMFYFVLQVKHYIELACFLYWGCKEKNRRGTQATQLEDIPRP